MDRLQTRYQVDPPIAKYLRRDSIAHYNMSSEQKTILREDDSYDEVLNEEGALLLNETLARIRNSEIKYYFPYWYKKGTYGGLWKPDERSPHWNPSDSPNFPVNTFYIVGWTYD